MKNLSLILNGILFLLVIYLYIDRFSGESDGEGLENRTENVEKEDSTAVVDYDIAYINSDSLVKKYQYFIDKRAELTERQQKLENEYRNRAEGLQKEFTEFQSTAGNMTINQARAIEEDLVRKRENLLRYQENIRNELLQEEGKANEEVYAAIDEFLKGYGKAENLRIVLSYVYGGNVLYADRALDITEEVIGQLNDRYVSEKEGVETGE
jgi:outer membrane protein